MRARRLRAGALRPPLPRVSRDTPIEPAALQSVWVELEDGAGYRGYGEACAQACASGETAASTLACIQSSALEWCSAVRDLASLRAWVATHGEVIDAHPAAWSAIELAMLDLFARRDGVSVEALLGLPALSGVYSYTAALGDTPPAAFEAALAACVAAGFTRYKVELGGRGAHDRAKAQALREAGIAPEQVCAAAARLFRNAREAVRYLDRLDYPFAALEEPLRASDLEGLSAVARACDCAIALDLGVARVAQVQALPTGMAWLVNVQVTKMGGVLRALAVADAAAGRGHGVIVGARPGESPLLGRAALTVAQGCREALHAQEGSFGAGARLCADDVPRGPGFGHGRGDGLAPAAP